MKKLLLVCLISLLVQPLPGVAQQESQAFRVYTEWRNATFKHYPRGVATPHYSLAAVTRRLNDESARIDFVVVGRMSSFSLEIQPLHIQKVTNGEDKQEAIGEISSAHMNGLKGNGTSNPFAELEITIPVDKIANALEVKWKAEGGPESLANTVILPLGTGSSESAVGIIP